jgi:hypothetical protein
MVARLRLLQARVLPNGWLDVLRQLLLCVGAYLLYSLVRGLVEGRATAAFQHARELIQFERTMHFFVEPSVQAWAMGSHFVMDVSSWLYLNAQTSITIGGLVYLYTRHNSSFYFVRNMFAVALLIALVAYAVFPTAPPRFLPEWGFVDTVSDVTPVSVSHTSSSMTALFNPYAAVPSMHVAFALMIGWTLAKLARAWIVRAVWGVYPLLITFAVIATANHFVLDAVLGALTTAVAALAAARMARIRPNAWRFAQPVAVG